MKMYIVAPPDSQVPKKENYPGETALQEAIRKAAEERERNSRKRVDCERLYGIIERNGLNHPAIDRLDNLNVDKLYVEDEWVFFEYETYSESYSGCSDRDRYEYCMGRRNFSSEQWERFASVHIRQRQREEDEEAESERKTRKREIEREARKARLRQQTSRSQRRRASGR